MLEVGGGLDLGEEPLAAQDGESSSRSTLSATLRSWRTSCAKYTVAMPPAPSSRSMT